MNDEPIDDSDRDMLAAEHALRLLGGSEQRNASALTAAEPAFAADVARWRGRLAGLSNDISETMPPAELWDRIARAIAAPSASNDNVVVLRRRLTVWRTTASAMTAVAAALALVLLTQPRNAVAPDTPRQQTAPMVAMLANDGKDMKVVASWDPVGRQLVLAVAGAMPSDPGRAHELWVIPVGGKPQSLGTMPASKQMHMRLPLPTAEMMRNGATIAISVEPRGGSPTGAPTGPVLASGALSEA